MVAATPTPAHPGRVSSGRGGSTHTRGRGRADVVALVASDAELLEYIRYSSYGVATSYPKGDYDLDGDVDSADTTALGNFIAGSGGWNLDFNRDGNTDGDDTTEHATYRTGYTGGTGGRGTLSRSALRNRLGYAGYQFDDTLSAYHVRHRVYFPEMGRWSRRDPAGYVDGMGLYNYVGSAPLRWNDSLGLYSIDCARNLFYRLQGGLTPTTNWQCRFDLISNLDACCAERDRSGSTSADFLRCINDSVSAYESCARRAPAPPSPPTNPQPVPDPGDGPRPGEDPNLPPLPFDPQLHDCLAACDRMHLLLYNQCGLKIGNPWEVVQCQAAAARDNSLCKSCCGGDGAKIRRYDCAQIMMVKFFENFFPQIDPRDPSTWPPPAPRLR